MKKVFLSVRKGVVVAGALVLMAAAFSACRKSSDNGPDIPAAGLMAFNLAPDQENIGIALSGSQLTNAPLAYTSYTGVYQNIYVGQRAVQSFDYRLDSTLASGDFNFEAKKYYSVFVIGNAGSYRNVVVHDDIDSLSSSTGLAYIRYINAIPDSSAPVVTISANGSNAVSEAAPFSTVSGFTGVNGGEVGISVNNGNTISAQRNITLESGKVYTALLVGVPGLTDTTKSVQIRYIQNGALSDTTGQ